MNNKSTVLLALAAGLVAGLVSRYAAPSVVHAQAPVAEREIRAQKFILVDETGAQRGAFGVETDGTVQIEVLDQKGKQWVYTNRPAKFGWTTAMMEDRPKELSLLR